MLVLKSSAPFYPFLLRLRNLFGDTDKEENCTLYKYTSLTATGHEYLDVHDD